MQHCAGGPATDQFNTLEALVNWVEHARAPDQLLGRAGPASPWPGRTRPLCAYPANAHYRGSGDIESASSFRCE
jgi:feruloyl esterase